jgi:hypothetical protein
MAYKGPLKIGSTVEAQLLLDHSAAGPAFLFVGYGRVGGSPNGGACTTVPGGTCRGRQTLDAQGRFEVAVDMSTNADTGVLVVSEDGQENTRENVQGDTVWVYAVV